MAETGHKELTSQDDFKAAIATKGRYVLIYAYQGEINPNADEAAKKHAATTDAYKVNIDKFPTAKENLKIATFPAVIVFKDGAEIKRLEGINKENAHEIAAILV